MNKNIDTTAKKLVNAFLKNKLISPIPKKYTKNIFHADKLRILCESKIKNTVIGYKAGGTALPLLKKFKEKEPFYAAVFKQNLLKNRSKVKINKYTLGIELEVCYLINKNIFDFKSPITKKNVHKYIMYMAPCIEIVGYRQKKIGIKSLGDLCSDFGANVKFILGKKIKYKRIKINNLKSIISNSKLNHSVSGNTKAVYVDPINSLRFVLKKLKMSKTRLNNNFYVFTGSTIGVAPIQGSGYYIGKIEKLGSVSVKII